jgi:hypothetical protein
LIFARRNSAASCDRDNAKQEAAMGRSYPKNTDRRPPVTIERRAYSIPQFCDAFSISVETYFKLARKGEGPRTFKIGSRTLISAQAAEQWLAEREREAAGTAKAPEQTTTA